MDPIIKKITDFLTSLNLQVLMEDLEENTFLPGLELRNGGITIDVSKLKHPGDILHEAGHLACMPPEIRVTMTKTLEDNDLHRGGELMAIAWSYAAALHLNINPEIVFHEEGYKGGGKYIIENFANGNFFGVPLLEWLDMTCTSQRASLLNAKPYPAMLKWTCTNRPA